MKPEDFILTIVFSHWTLSKILNFLVDYLSIKPDDIGPCKIERYRDKRTGIFKDSNRTLILLKKQVYEKAVEFGLNKEQKRYDFRIDAYRYKLKDHPSSGYNMNLFLVVPKQLNSKEVEIALLNKLQELVKYGFLNTNDFKLEIALESRISGEAKGFAVLKFSEDLDVQYRVTVKLLLHDCFIYLPTQDKLYHLPVFWNKL